MNTFKTIKNLTPHTVNLLDQGGQEIMVITSQGESPRLQSTMTDAGDVAGYPLVRQEFGETTGLPEAEEGVLILVSRLVLAANPERKDLGVPVQFVRDTEGRILGCQAIEVR
ncbi:MAG: hypothetical protein P8P29_00730 [Flavobacteriaceae bacterium]|nr:hypothetical protein [Flavobacteriaceae bacterium]